MCGIAGFVGRFDDALLDAMGRAVQHRGPDGSGGLTVVPPGGEGVRVGLAHRRLSILDLSSSGRQPMTVACPCCGVGGAGDPAAGVWLTYNGEVYNFAELRRGLEARGHRFHSHTDSEVLIHLYLEEGVEMLARLNGIFAFAIYDGRERGQKGPVRRGDVFVARDGLGVKPLYYAALPEGVLFASEIKALLQSRAVPRDLDPVALHHHLAYLWAPAPRTALKHVRKLPPGSALLLRGGRIAHEWAYYDLPYGREPMPGSEAEIADSLRRELEEAVARQMVADVPVGAFLSGGLDSSAVVAMMKRAVPESRPRCYSIGFRGDDGLDGSPADLPYARRVAEHLGVDLHAITVEPDVIGRLEQMLYLLDEPQADPAPINALLIAEQARRDGIKVLLSGAGGDDIFSGYRRHRALAMERLWGWLPHAARAGIAAGARGAGSGRWRTDGALARRMVKMFSHADLDGDRRMASYFWWSGEEMRRSLYSPRLAAELEGVDTAAPLVESLARIPGERDPLNRMLYLEGKHFLADHNLNYTDRMGMAAGVEVRVPLLDLRLVDFATRVPSALKQKGGVGKYVFKRAMEPYLPHDVIYRPKSGFGAPLRRWLRVELRELVEDVLSHDSIARRGLFDPGAVRRLIELDRAGKVDGSYTVFSLICTELWCRMFVDAVPFDFAGHRETGSPAYPHPAA
jgi:asparagine synthase (glutamine-hydrolysing)